jgi:tetratricopeptide (TPR) repeat protein
MADAWNLARKVLGLASILALVGYVLYRWWKHSDDRPGLLWRWIITFAALLFLALFVGPMVADFSYTAAFIGIPLAGVVGAILATVWAPRITESCGRKVAALIDGGDVEPDPQPFLSIAEARRKAGRFAEAEAELRRQLEVFPTHFQTQMLLAEIQAENRHDLDAATATVEQIASQPDHVPKNVAFALTRLADWQLKLAKNPDAARGLFERIIALFPDSPEAHHAHQRLAHLASPEFLSLSGAIERTPIKLTQSDPRLGLRSGGSTWKPAPPDPAARAQALVAQLERFPMDNQAREELALVYANEFHRADLAADQLEQLIAQPNAPDSQIARWLNLLADVVIKEADRPDAARIALNRIVELFPDSGAAEGARRRLATLGLEFRAKKQSQVVRLGSEESESDRPIAEPRDPRE